MRCTPSGLRFAAVALFVAVTALAQAQSINTPPPRSVEDILAVLDQYKPDPAMVERARAAASAQPPPGADNASLAEFYLQRSSAAEKIGSVTQQIADLRLALDYAQKGGGREFRVRQFLSLAEADSGNVITGLQTREQSLEKTTSISGRMSVYVRLAFDHVTLGDLAAARQVLVRSEQVFAESKSDPNATWFEHERMYLLERTRETVLSAEGKIPEAEQAMRHALHEIELDIPANKNRLSRKLSTNTQEFKVEQRDRYELRLAQILRLAGKLGEAEGSARNALIRILSRAGRYSAQTSSALRILGEIIFEQGRFHEAELLAGAAIDISLTTGAIPESMALIGGRRNLGTAYVAQGQWRQALGEFDSIVAGVQHDPQFAQRYAVRDINWGLALVKTGQADKAVPMLDALTKQTSERFSDAAYETAQTRGFLALALAASGQRERALAEFSRAVPVLLDQARLYGESEEGGVIRAMRLTFILEAYLSLLADLHHQKAKVAGLDVIPESFRIADVARSSGVQRALSASAARSSIGDPKLAVLAREEQDAQQRLGTLSALLSRLLAAPPDQQLPKIIGEIRSEIDRLRANRSKLKLEIEQRFPEYANLIDPKPPALEQARAALREGEALISIYAGENKTYVWAIPKLGAPAFAVVPLGDKEAARIVAGLREALDVGEGSITQFPRYDVGAAYKLYSELLAPVDSGWKDATSLLIVPHGAFGQLPFGLLVTAATEVLNKSGMAFEGYKEVPWLIRKAAITQLPSVNAFVTLRSTRPPSNERRAFAGFGDPYFSKEQRAQADKQGLTQVALLTRGMTLRNLNIAKVALPVATPGIVEQSTVVRNAPVVANSSMLAQLSRLPETAEEIRDIARALKADAANDVFLGVAANEKNVKTVDLSNRKVIAFATHGLVPGDLNGLEQPALALTAPDVAGIDGDGLLTMDEILGLKLNADWVVLSACNTASGDGAGAEAVSGLGRAFFYAGARALLVSNWPVETRSARLLTTDLFKRQSENPNLTRAEALRQTMLGLMDKEGQRDAQGKLQFSYAHPMFWAPFSLVGDGGAQK